MSTAPKDHTGVRSLGGFEGGKGDVDDRVDRWWVVAGVFDLTDRRPGRHRVLVSSRGGDGQFIWGA